ncbi:MAG: nucleoside triphosphate pyrophosphatase [Gammaproteobacteria bacterium]
MPVKAPPLILASTSRYRAELLRRLGLPFDAVAPAADETPLEGEAPAALVQRLALLKAANVVDRHPDSVVIGSDQVATFDGQIIGKPGSPERAVAQLRRASGRDVTFLTAVCVQHGARKCATMDVTRVAFRDLEDQEIERYVAAEQPLDCAGSFKAEGLGITLFEQIDAKDPTGLIGLPLIWLSHALRTMGYRLP